ncbi:NADP-dependent oxidoreductase domain-containing protein [Xylaria cf. heliscus]|nr:NADP-dependent oxidoreductase domain-containing protein [Xylaria cf. heliscus]
MAIPRLLYGTAWKKEATGDLVFKALKAGFRGVDTAAQPRHYNEALVSAGVREAISKGIVKREDLFIQTKFTPVGGQDLHNMPYDPNAPLDEQVHTSISSSLANFTFDDSATPYIDSLVLHTPPSNHFSDLLKVWKALETYVPHRIRQLGISNTDLHVVSRLCTSPDVSVRPAVVQNRFYPATQWDVGLREYCRIQSITFQTFWTLTGNPELLRSAPVQELAEAAAISPSVALYALVLGLEGTTILDGTTSEEHMAEDLKVTEIVDGFAQSENGRAVWVACLDKFKALIGESA